MFDNTTVKIVQSDVVYGNKTDGWKTFERAFTYKKTITTPPQVVIKEILTFIDHDKKENYLLPFMSSERY